MGGSVLSMHRYIRQYRTRNVARLHSVAMVHAGSDCAGWHWLHIHYVLIHIDCILDKSGQRLMWITSFLKRRVDMMQLITCVHCATHAIAIRPLHRMEGLAMHESTREMFNAGNHRGGRGYRIARPSRPMTVAPVFYTHAQVSMGGGCV